jgi:3-hydroxyacyl-[acyl-carrier-protein] dehydratase
MAYDAGKSCVSLWSRGSGARRLCIRQRKTGGVLWLHGQGEGADDADALIFGGARNCRSLGPVRPGDVKAHVVRHEMLKGDNAVMSGSTWVGDRCVATVDTMIAVVRPRADRLGGRTG